MPPQRRRPLTHIRDLLLLDPGQARLLGSLALNHADVLAGVLDRSSRGDKGAIGVAFGGFGVAG